MYFRQTLENVALCKMIENACTCTNSHQISPIALKSFFGGFDPNNPLQWIANRRNPITYDPQTTQTSSDGRIIQSLTDRMGELESELQLMATEIKNLREMVEEERKMEERDDFGRCPQFVIVRFGAEES
ncbi:hypothetical protein MIR68_002513 [Amoeboaphelidium protococcarum]|nr:hypothetical protein MIR68_002513 [Amoeboaphelidium protococcarum]